VRQTFSRNISPSCSVGNEVDSERQFMASVQSRIWVVDDEAVIATTLAAILRMQGFDAKSFTLPLAAFQAARSESPDLLISDVIMPEMSGIDLALKIKELWPPCKVLLFSGQAATSDLLEKAESKGHFFEILAKPVHPTVLLSTVKNILHGNHLPTT
jgi:DNA-binding NtrC family response regulator